MLYNVYVCESFLAVLPCCSYILMSLCLCVLLFHNTSKLTFSPFSLFFSFKAKCTLDQILWEEVFEIFRKISIVASWIS